MLKIKKSFSIFATAALLATATPDAQSQDVVAFVAGLSEIPAGTSVSHTNAGNRTSISLDDNDDGVGNVRVKIYNGATLMQTLQWPSIISGGDVRTGYTLVIEGVSTSGALCNELPAGGSQKIGSSDLIGASDRLNNSANSFVCVTDIIQPIEWISVSARQNGKDIVIEGKGEMQNVDSVGVQVSGDGKTFFQVGEMKKVTQPNGIATHTFTLDAAQVARIVQLQGTSGVVYTRLVSKDMGKTEEQYSKIASVELTNLPEQLSEFLVTPSYGAVESMNITFTGEESTDYTLHIIDAVTAKLVGTRKVKGNTSVNMSSFGIDIPQGIYIIRVEGLSQLAKILITK